MDYRRLRDTELGTANDDQLIEQAVAARAAGDNEEVRRVLGTLAFRRYGDVKRRVGMKVPRAHVEDVASEALLSAVKASFDGESVGQFMSLLHTVTDRRVADFHEKQKRLPKTRALPEDHEEAEDIWGNAAISEDFTPHVALREIFAIAKGELSPVHRAVVELYVEQGCSAKEAAEAVNRSMGQDLTKEMTESNVHQIAGRFRKRLRELLDEERGTG